MSLFKNYMIRRVILSGQYHKAKEQLKDYEKKLNDKTLNQKEVEICKYKTEERVYDIIDNRPEILRICDSEGNNLGMLSASLGLEQLTLRCLNDKIASTKKNKDGKNIGMICAENGLEDATIKALDNKFASIQQDNLGNNIGMYSAISNLKDATNYALENNFASKQKNKDGKSISDLLNERETSYDFEIENFEVESMEN